MVLSFSFVSFNSNSTLKLGLTELFRIVICTFADMAAKDNKYHSVYDNFDIKTGTKFSTEKNWVHKSKKSILFLKQGNCTTTGF